MTLRSASGAAGQRLPPLQAIRKHAEVLCITLRSPKEAGMHSAICFTIHPACRVKQSIDGSLLIVVQPVTAELAGLVEANAGEVNLIASQSVFHPKLMVAGIDGAVSGYREISQDHLKR